MISNDDIQKKILELENEISELKQTISNLEKENFKLRIANNNQEDKITYLNSKTI